MVSDVAPQPPDDLELGHRLVLHEARAQLGPGRELRDLGDGWLLHDRADPEPFWNRLMAPRWPAAAEAFDRRLDEVITLFSTLGRLSHVRPAPAGNQPLDLVPRLRAAGFDRVGEDRRMVLVDPAICLALADAPLPPRVAVERLPGPRPDLVPERHPGHPSHENGRDAAAGVVGPRRPSGPRRRRWSRPGDPPMGDLPMGDLAGLAAIRSPGWAREVAAILAEAFGVEPMRRLALESDALAFVERGKGSLVLLREDGEAVAVARGTSRDGGTYLSSIATRPERQGRGFGALATAIAVADAMAIGDRVIHLAVETSNERAVGIYLRLGFRLVGDPIPDLLLR